MSKAAYRFARRFCYYNDAFAGLSEVEFNKTVYCARLDLAIEINRFWKEIVKVLYINKFSEFLIKMIK